MRGLTAPGLWFEPVAPLRASGRLSRGDVAVFLGYARRGPAGRPVRLGSLTLAQEIFGPPLEGGHLQASLKGFFENGGRTAYVIRLVPPSAGTASARVGGWVARASFGWSLVDPRERRREARPDEATWVQLVEEVFRTTGPRSPAPGAWGNACDVRIVRTARARTESIPAALDDPRALWLRSLAGLEAHSVVVLGQTRQGASREVTVSVAGTDPARQRLLLPQRLTGLRDAHGRPVEFAPDQPVQVTSVEFDIEIRAAGQLEQAFRALAPDPRHSASIAAVMGAAARSVALLPEDVGGDDWADPAHWPAEGSFRLTGGSDGLDAVSAGDWLAGLAQVARLDEAALIAAPDLVLQPLMPDPAEPMPPEPADCCDLSPRAPGMILARVVEERADGAAPPLAGVEVDVLGPGGRTRTDAEGVFLATGIPVGLATLRLSKDGYIPAEVVVQAEGHVPAAPVTLSMAPLTLPRALVADEVLRVVAAMTDPALVGPYKVAVVDPPRPDATLDDLRAWRARLGESNRMAFVAPWLRLPPEGAGPGPGGLPVCPPSGHVCGAFARAELSVGIHRTGANLPLRHVEAPTLEIDEAAHGLINPEGINAIRSFAGRGIRLYGTRTLSADPEWRYLTARRVVDAIEKTLERGLHWMVFEPNDLMTRHAVAQSAVALLDRLWREGVLAGSAPAEAYGVKCDIENNPEEGRATGQLVVDVAVAPTAPLEFILFRLGNALDALKVTEATR
ncbi:phage tail sheath C-terminal domain-containing protein [Cereibacter azotoformans]|uniref:Tail sheath protein n=1 Tax=Cereibacter azotoformans TaxID=43057 RepID=A0A2T5JUP8_9RHOB|nr:phage tail sheath C-terminal domain-containing protein [Cereibacter azotoformans]AXQ96268.1 phage tail sheath protein [Cereibacter sphaeroides]PTR13894.1 tail sheath protein [Cereibacter azotoformans]